jgi:monoamine oxidase
MPRMRVCVIGAGLAGLAAAEALVHGGAEVVVLEARRRPGGRVVSQELANGAIVERGAEFVEGEAHVLRAACERHGLRLQRAGMAYGDRAPRGGLGVSRRELLDGVAALALALEERRPDPAQSVASLLAGVRMTAGAREAIAARIAVSSAQAVDDLAADSLGPGASFSPAESFRIAGGNARLAYALARTLGRTLHLDTPVRAVGWRPNGVTVRTDDGEVAADRCIVAAPASVVDRIAFQPALPPAKALALAGRDYGQAAKLFVPLAAVTAPSAVLAVEDGYWCWTANGRDGGVQPVVTAFAGSRRALEGLHLRGGPERWLSRLSRLRPDLALDAAGVELATWHDDPWARGAYSTVRPGRPQDDSELARAYPPLHFAGEHTAGHNTGLMEGALRSGLRAAQEVLGR